MTVGCNWFGLRWFAAGGGVGKHFRSVIDLTSRPPSNRVSKAWIHPASFHADEEMSVRLTRYTTRTPPMLAEAVTLLSW
jgi:hypothetical protein